MHSREYFSACSGRSVLDIQHKTKGNTFELCQAGYPDRKLFYDTRTGLVFLHECYFKWLSNVRQPVAFNNFCNFSSFYVVPKTTHHTGHHEFFEGVIYDRTSGHTKFYLRPKNNTFHHEVIVVHDHTNNRGSEPGHVRSTRFAQPQVVRPDTVSELTHALFEAHPKD